MKKKTENKKGSVSGDEKFPLPIYTPDEDIYQKDKEVPFKEKGENRLDAKLSEDLDVPGADLDDENENIGEEDEENNYYSLGGDDHNDLEEDKEEDR